MRTTKLYNHQLREIIQDMRSAADLFEAELRAEWSDADISGFHTFEEWACPFSLTAIKKLRSQADFLEGAIDD